MSLKANIAAKSFLTIGLVSGLILPNWLIILPEMSGSLATFGISVQKVKDYEYAYFRCLLSRPVIAFNE